VESQTAELAIPGSAGHGAPSIDLSKYFNISVQAAGITSSELNLEASIDGTNYVAIKATMGVAIYTLAALIGAYAAVKYLRVTTVAISGGDTPTVTFLAQSLGF
jgi:hypothetical protein